MGFRSKMQITDEAVPQAEGVGKARAPHMLPPAAQGRARTDPMAKPFGARGLRRRYLQITAMRFKKVSRRLLGVLHPNFWRAP
jgi:hypothetical protein